jgi:hypothetical protein
MRQSEYAKRLGLCKQRIHQLKRDGRVVVGDDGLVDVEASDRNLATMIDQRKANVARQIELAGRASSAAEPQFEVAVAELAASEATTAPEVAPASSGPSSPNAAADYWTHKALREASEAALSELKLREKRGDVCDRSGVRKAIGEIVGTFCGALQLLPAQLAPTVVGIPDPQKVEALLRGAIERLMHEFSGQMDVAA